MKVKKYMAEENNELDGQNGQKSSRQHCAQSLNCA